MDRQPDAWHIKYRASRAGMATEGLTPTEILDHMATRILDQMVEIGTERRRREELEQQNAKLRKENRELRERLQERGG